MLIDSHCHLLHPRFGEEPAQTPANLLADAQAAGVAQVVNVACRREEWAPALALAEAEARVWVAAGIHPHDAGEGGMVTLDELAGLAAHPRVVALGETGLDYYYDTAPKAVQQESFHLHLQAAKAAGLPVVIHTRDAEDDTLAILREHMGVPFVLHCFTGTAAMAAAAVEMGGYISFSGVLTFKKSDDLRAIAATLPHDRVLVETDAPYLAPEPKRGKRCTPAMVAHTAACLAKVWQMGDDGVADITATNTCRLLARMAGC
ncbi:MAG: TatD family hydrolase [Pseudomonadaceae bacterium]|nr:TatD family hydrolase [Pseudomonadaceae bacterium]